MQPVYGVYVLSNPMLQDTVKIGFTTGHINKRMGDLQGSGVPKPFACEVFVHCSNPYGLEQQLHDHFGSKRVGKEFFKVSPETVQAEAIRLLGTQDYTVVIGKTRKVEWTSHPALGRDIPSDPTYKGIKTGSTTPYKFTNPR